MATAFASGNWQVKEGAEATFVERWQAFLDWTLEAAPGLRLARLFNDADNPRHFISLAEWCCPTHRAAWKAHPDFAAHLMACRQLCTDFHGADYAMTASVQPALQEA